MYGWMKTCVVRPHGGPCKDGGSFFVRLRRDLLKPLPLLLEVTLLDRLRFWLRTRWLRLG